MLFKTTPTYIQFNIRYCNYLLTGLYGPKLIRNNRYKIIKYTQHTDYLWLITIMLKLVYIETWTRHLQACMYTSTTSHGECGSERAERGRGGLTFDGGASRRDSQCWQEYARTPVGAGWTGVLGLDGAGWRPCWRACAEQTRAFNIIKQIKDNKQ